MSGFYQATPYWAQSRLFQTALFITGTDKIQKPVDYVLLGNQRIKDRWREYDVRPPEIKYTTSKLMRRG